MGRYKAPEFLHVIIPVIVLVISFCILRPMTTSPSFTSETTSYLEGKKEKVLEITAASTAASAAITMIPGDTGTPIAEKLADISGYSVIILCAVFLEKYLAGLMGYISFGLIIPIACILYIINYAFIHRRSLRFVAMRLAGFAIAISLVIPVSVKASQIIDRTSEASIQETINQAQQSAEEIRENTNGQENDTLWNKFINTIEGGIDAVTVKFEGILNSFIEAVAIMLVTACLIPVLVLLILAWLAKTLVTPYVPELTGTDPLGY